MSEENARLLLFHLIFDFFHSVCELVSRKCRELFGPEEPFVKLRPAYSVKLVFSYVVKEIKIKISAKCRTSRRLRFEEAKRIMRPKSFGTFEKQTRGPSFSKHGWWKTGSNIMVTSWF